MKEFDYNELAMRTFLERIYELEEALRLVQCELEDSRRRIRELEKELEQTELRLEAWKEKYRKDI